MSYKKNLISLGAFLKKGNLYILDVIKICNLKNTNHWSEWIDDYGNKLIINNSKKITISFKDDVDIQCINSKDLYIKTGVENISKKSTFAFIAIVDTSYFVWLLDINNILRLYVYMDNIFIGTQPVLLSNANTLIKIVENVNVEKFREIDHITVPGSKIDEVDKAWATQLPMSEELSDILPEIIKKDLNFHA